ncbi:MAG: TIGR02301 family protein [Hyphomicrobiales bacterium]
MMFLAKTACGRGGGRAMRPAAPAMLAAALAIFIAAGAASFAQDAPPAPSGAAPAGQPPYELQILRLAELLGAIQAIDGLCEITDKPAWRDEMIALIDTEAKAPDRKARFVDHFNRGFKSFSEVHRSCSDSARAIRGRYLREGAELARDLVSRYGQSTR